METHEPRNAFDIPKPFYFEAGNIHTGSRKQLRYRIEPTDGLLHTEIWRQDLCYELIKEQNAIEGNADFPLSEDGFQQMIDYLQAEFDKAE